MHDEMMFRMAGMLCLSHSCTIPMLFILFSIFYLSIEPFQHLKSICKSAEEKMRQQQHEI